MVLGPDRHGEAFADVQGALAAHRLVFELADFLGLGGSDAFVHRRADADLVRGTDRNVLGGAYFFLAGERDAFVLVAPDADLFIATDRLGVVVQDFGHAILGRVHKDLLAAFKIFKTQLVLARGADHRLGLIGTRHHAGHIRVRHRAGDDRAIGVTVDVQQQHFSGFVQRKMHAVVTAAVRLDHAHRLAGGAIGGLAAVERELHVIATDFV